MYLKMKSPNTQTLTLIHFPSPNYDDVQMGFVHLKNTKGTEIRYTSVELFKQGRDEMIRCMHKLFNRIMTGESMPYD